jgi:hypothetical protein
VRLGDLLVALEDHLARGFVDDVHRGDAFDGIGADEIFQADLDPFGSGLDDLADARSGELAVLPQDDVSASVPDLLGAALTHQESRNDALHDLLAVDTNRLGIVEVVEKLLGRVAKRLQQDGRMDLTAPVDPGVEQILVVELEVQPGSAIGNDPAGIDLLAGRGDRGRGGGVEEDSR